jgi:D-arabinose 1-dehydrogenase
MAPLDVLLSFSHNTLQNNRLELYLNPLLQAGKVKQIMTAAPLSMGLLGPIRPQSWHPAPQDLIEASRLAEATAASSSGVGWPGGLPNLALSYAFRRPKSHAEMSPLNDVPTVVGLSSLQEVHDAMAIWREVSIPGTNTVRKSKEDLIRRVFQAAGWLNWSWSAPENSEFDTLAVDQLNRRIRRSKGYM